MRRFERPGSDDEGEKKVGVRVREKRVWVRKSYFKVDKMSEKGSIRDYSMRVHLLYVLMHDFRYGCPRLL